MLTTQHKEAIRRSWQLVVPIGDTAADLFYKRLFELEPRYRTLFPQDMAPQKRKLLAMLAFMVKSVDWPAEAWQESVNPEEDLLLVVLALGRRHSDLYEVPDASYETVGQALLWTLDYGLGEAFTEDVHEAWASMYTLVAKTMKMGRLYVGEASFAKQAG